LASENFREKDNTTKDNSSIISDDGSIEIGQARAMCVTSAKAKDVGLGGEDEPGDEPIVKIERAKSVRVIPFKVDDVRVDTTEKHNRDK
jgi:hypothetical protein